MSKVYRQVYLHLVWSTWKRERILVPEVEDIVHARTRQICSNLNLGLLAINSAWDHTHVLVEWNTTVAIGDGVREIKSRISNEWNAQARTTHASPLLKWQRGYGVLSIRKSDIPRVATYIRNQKRHHQNNELWGPFERKTGEDEGE